jgi:uncharacterized membrane protein
VGGYRSGNANGTYYANWGNAPGDRLTARIRPTVTGDYLLQADAAVGKPIDTGVGGGTKLLRVVGLGLIAVISAANAWSVALLVDWLISGPNAPNATELLRSGAAVWLTNVFVFALWYWELDRGGPAARSAGRRDLPDFEFAQMTEKSPAPADWEPHLVDYLYLSFTNATAFSPTDVLPLSRWAKLTMMLQSAVSLVTVALVIARAVNVLT